MGLVFEKRHVGSVNNEFFQNRSHTRASNEKRKNTEEKKFWTAATDTFVYSSWGAKLKVWHFLLLGIKALLRLCNQGEYYLRRFVELFVLHGAFVGNFWEMCWTATSAPLKWKESVWMLCSSQVNLMGEQPGLKNLQEKLRHSGEIMMFLDYLHHHMLSARLCCEGHRGSAWGQQWQMDS